MRRRTMMINEEVPSVEAEDTFSKDLVAYYNVADLDNESLSVNPVLPDLSGNGHDMELKNFGDNGGVDLTTWVIERNGTVENTLTRTKNKVIVTNIANNLAFIWSNVDSTVSDVLVKVEGLQSGQSLSFGTDQRKDGAYTVTKDGIYKFDYTQYCDNPIGTPINRCIWSDTISGACNFSIEFLNIFGEVNTYPTAFDVWNSHTSHSTLTENTATKISGTPIYYGNNCWLKYFRMSNPMPSMVVKCNIEASTNLYYRYYNNGEHNIRLTNGIQELPASYVYPGVTDTYNPWAGFFIQNSAEGNSATIELFPKYSGIREIYPEDFTRYNLGYNNGNDHSDFEVTATPTLIHAKVVSLDKTNGSGSIAWLNTTATNSSPVIKVRITMSNPSRRFYYNYVDSKGNEHTIIFRSNGIYTLPSCYNKGPNTWTGFLCNGANYVIGDYIIIEQLPIDKYLQFDGVDDYGKAENIPLLTDFTVIAKRRIYKIENGCVLNKGDSTYGSNNTISLEGMERLQPSFPVVYSMGAATSIDIYDNNITYMTKSSYNGKDINIGSTPDTSSNIYIGTFRDGDSRYLDGSISAVLLFNRTLTLSEINKAIQKYIW